MKRIVTGLVLGLTLMVQAQVKEKDVLFTVDGDPVMATEFVRVYNKNLDLVKDESQKDIDAYLELFVNYQLKVKEARRLELDKDERYIREFNNYKKQLSKNYMSDNKVTDALVEEAYERTTNDVKASHILISIDANAKDTTDVYNQLLKLRERVINEGYEAVQKDVHNGRTIFAEDLGYFGGFKMVYPFETAAFNTPVGEVSMPFRTRFGYHIVKVFDKRKSLGEVTVSHIMVSKVQKDSTIDPKNRIYQIYKKLQQGENFESLAKQFSDDKGSAKKGGALPAFTGGQLASKEFEDVAFSLETPGDISEPFKSDFGWHIVKLNKKIGVKPFEEVRSELENRVKRDSRSALINSALVKKLAAKYDVEENAKAKAYFAGVITDDYFRNAWKLPEDLKADQTLIAIGDTKATYKDFAERLLKKQRVNYGKRVPADVLIENEYQEFYEEFVLRYHEDHLEFENPDFAFVLKEYRDGLLLFDLMEKEVWNAAAKDSVGLQKFYETHKSDYRWNDRADAVMISSASESNIETVKAALEKGDTPETVMTTLNTDGGMNLIATSEVFEKGDQALPADFEFKTGVSKIYKHHDAYHVFMVKAVLPADFKTLEEARGRVVSDYQAFIEDNWVKTLHERFEVKLDKAVLKRVKKEILNQ